MTIASNYRVEFRDLAFLGWGQRIATVPLKKFTVNEALNGPGSFDAEVAVWRVTHTANFPACLNDVGKLEIIVYRSRPGLESEKAVWGGYLTDVQVNTNDQMVKLTGEGYWSRLRRRYVRGTTIYNDGTQGSYSGEWKAEDIAWDLIDRTQALTNGSLGITRGVTDTGTPERATRELCGADRDNIGDVIETMASEGLFDFNVRPNNASPTSSNVAKFDTYGERGSDLTASVIFNGTNTITLDYSLIDEIATVVDAFGTQECETSSAAVSVSTNTGIYGRLEADPIDVESDMSGEVTKAANDYIRSHKRPVHTASVTYWEGDDQSPNWTGFNIGDKVHVEPNDGITNDFDAKVMARSISVENTWRKTSSDFYGVAMISVELQERHGLT